MGNKYREIRRYLLKEQGFDEDVVNEMSNEELIELWNHYHEDYEIYY